MYLRGIFLLNFRKIIILCLAFNFLLLNSWAINNIEEIDYLRADLACQSDKNSPNYISAKKKLQRLIAQSKIDYSANSRLNDVQRLVKEKKYNAALYELNDMIDSKIAVSKASEMLGDLYIHLDKPLSKSIKCYKKAVETDNYNLSATLKLAKIYLKADKNLSGIKCLKKIVDLSSDTTYFQQVEDLILNGVVPKDRYEANNLYEILGMLYLKSGRKVEGYKALAKALEVNSEDIYLRYRFANILFSDNDNQNALVLFNSILDENPNDTQIRVLRAKTLLRLGDYNGSYSEYAKILNDYPNSNQAKYGIYQIYKNKLTPEEIILKFHRNENLYTVTKEETQEFIRFLNEIKDYEGVKIFNNYLNQLIIEEENYKNYIEQKRLREQERLNIQLQKAREIELAEAEEKPAKQEEKPKVVEQKPATADKKVETVVQKPVVVQQKPKTVEQKPIASEKKQEIVEKPTVKVEQKPAIVEKKIDVVAQKPKEAEQKQTIVEKKPEAVVQKPAVAKQKPIVVEKKPEQNIIPKNEVIPKEQKTQEEKKLQQEKKEKLELEDLEKKKQTELERELEQKRLEEQRQIEKIENRKKNDLKEADNELEKAKNSKEYNRYKKTIDNYLAIKPITANTYIATANTYKQARMPYNAIKYYNEAKKLEPLNSDIYYNIGLTYMELNRLEDSKENLEKALNLDNENKKAQTLLSFVNQKMATSVINKAYTNFQNNKLIESYTILDNGIKEIPNNAQLYYYRALVTDKMNRNAASIIDLQKSIELDPTYYMAYYNLGKVYEKIKDYKSALVAYERFLSMEPDEKELVDEIQKKVISLGEKYY